MSPARRRWLVAAVMSGLLLAMLDQSIVGTALPRIVETLGGSDLYVWVATAYLVTATVSLPDLRAALRPPRPARAAADRHGRCSWPAPALAATSQNMEQLIAYRALQGLGAGALEGLSFILVADLFGGRRNAALQGALAGLMGVSLHRRPAGRRLPRRPRRLALGVHGQPADRARGAGGRRRPSCPPRWARASAGARRSTWTGIALLTLGVGLLLVGLSERVVALIVAGLAVIAVFIAVERRAVAPGDPAQAVQKTARWRRS